MRIGKKIVGTFNSEQDVMHAIEGLKNQGYRETDMMVVAKNYGDISSITARTGVMAEAEVQMNSLAGAMVDSFFMMMTGGMGGSQTRTLTGRLIERGLPEFIAKQCEAETQKGKMVLLIDTNDAYGSSVFSEIADLNYMGEEQKSIRLREEQLDITKERVKIGELQLRKEVIEEQRTVHVPLIREEVYIERRPVIDGKYDGSPLMEDEIIRIPIMEERIEITKKPVVVEEVIIGKRKIQETKLVQDIIKKEEAHIERSVVPVIESPDAQTVIDLMDMEQEGTFMESVNAANSPNIASLTTEDKKEEPRAKQTDSTSLQDSKSKSEGSNKAEMTADTTDPSGNPSGNHKEKTSIKNENSANSQEGKNNKTQINKKKS